MHVEDFILDPDEYIVQKFKKNAIYIHHTAGSHRPDWTINTWNNDGRGRIATAYVIGGVSITNGDNAHDGAIYRAFQDKYWAYHLGPNLSKPNRESIGIEICNYGPLKLGKDGKFYNWVNKHVPAEYVCELEEPFRGYKYYHAYTEAQIESVRQLLTDIAFRHGIPLDAGLIARLERMTPNDAFDFTEETVKNASGVWTHTNIRKDKTDCSPQPILVDMLRNVRTDWKNADLSSRDMSGFRHPDSMT